jgi:hypothetical protein
MADSKEHTIVWVGYMVMVSGTHCTVLPFSLLTIFCVSFLTTAYLLHERVHTNTLTARL